MIEKYPAVSDRQAWESCDTEDLWVFDKLIVAKKCGHICGPKYVDVPRPDTYMVRPIMNLYGMGLGARFVHLENQTDSLNNGEFWCEVFEGRHISIDYVDGEQVLAVEGVRDIGQPIQRFARWFTVDDKVELPDFLKPLAIKYKTLNIEMIGGKIIEVHLRRNPEFRWGNALMIPWWKDKDIPKECYNMQVIKDDPTESDDDRIGIFIK